MGQNPSNVQDVMFLTVLCIILLSTVERTSGYCVYKFNILKKLYYRI